MPYTLADVMSVYEGSDAGRTVALYKVLTSRGWHGQIVVDLLRAHKASSRAKVYRGRVYRGAAYDRKKWAMSNLCSTLSIPNAEKPITWGWGVDEYQAMHRDVLYVDAPQGQVSFHSGQRLNGPDYPGTWDGVKGVGATRICGWAAFILASEC